MKTIRALKWDMENRLVKLKIEYKNEMNIRRKRKKRRRLKGWQILYSKMNEV